MNALVVETVHLLYNAAAGVSQARIMLLLAAASCSFRGTKGSFVRSKPS